MRILLPLALCGSLAVGLAGCEDRDKPATNPPVSTQPDRSQPLPPAEQAERETSPDRLKAIDDSRSTMDKLHDQWLAFKRSASETGRELKEDTRKAMDDADAKWEQAKQDFDNWQHASGQAWDSAKLQFESSWEHFKQAFTDARESYDANRVEPAPEPAPAPITPPAPAPTPPAPTPEPEQAP